MKKYNYILAALDLTEIDRKVIPYAAHLARVFQARKVIFMHVIQAYDLPDRGGKPFPDIKTSLRDIIRREFEESAGAYFENQDNVEIDVRIEDENAAQVVVDYVDAAEVDLTIIGEKIGEDRKTYYGRKIAAEAASDVLIIPEYGKMAFNAVLCALDFSRESELAFHVADKLAKWERSKIHFFYLYDNTKAYFPATTLPASKKRVVRRMRKKYSEFLNAFGVDYAKQVGELSFAISEVRHAAELILDRAEQHHSDMIIIGAKGMPKNVTTLLGNILENLRMMEKNIPLWITKNENQYKTFWDKLVGS